jgi:succinate dehydrogenase/fumarate reductase flavoprotein subunit
LFPLQNQKQFPKEILFMSRSKERKKPVTRRDFLGKGAAFAAGTLAASAPIAMAAPQQQQKPWLPKKWDYEADVIIAGMGYAGQSAAIAAHDAGAKVILLEKTTKEHSGGNSAVSVGGNSVWEDPKECYMDLQHAGCDVPDELVRTMVDVLTSTGKQNVLDWLKKLGIELKARSSSGTRKPWFIVADETAGANGSHLHRAIQAQVEKRNINIMYETPAKELVQDPVSKEILGVVAYEGAKGFYGEGGKKVYIKAKKGVILACGGYEGNLKMWSYFNFPGMEVFAGGTPYNTGDGILMASEVGAPLWHMFLKEWEAGCCAPASREFGCAIECSLQRGHIYVNRAGERFMNETISFTHRRLNIEPTDFKTGIDVRPGLWHGMGGYANMPYFLVCDDAYKKKGPFVSPLRPNQDTKFAHVKKLYNWSKDNSAEIAKGWVKQADTIAELASKLKISAEGLQHTVDQVNEVCKTKKDPLFNNTTLLPIESPPFYGMEMALSLINTMGGPQHNGKGQTLNKEGKPIPRLYSVGELGSFFSLCYTGGTNIPEAHTFGRIAGEHAAGLKPWG